MRSNITTSRLPAQCGAGLSENVSRCSRLLSCADKPFSSSSYYVFAYWLVKTICMRDIGAGKHLRRAPRVVFCSSRSLYQGTDASCTWGEHPPHTLSHIQPGQCTPFMSATSQDGICFTSYGVNWDAT